MSAPRRLLLVLTSLALPSVLAGCGSAEPACVAPVTGSASYTASSVPPPYHVEWTVTVDADRGRIEVTPGYGAPERWAADFPVDQDLVAAACRSAARAEQVDQPPPGSAVMSVDLRDGDGDRVERRTTVTTSSEVYTAVQATVPTATWDQVYGAYESWSKGQ